MFVTASHWWKRGKSMLVRRTDVPVATSHSCLVSTIISRPMMVSQACFSQTRSHRYAVADRPPSAGGFPAPPSYPMLNGKNCVFSPSSRVVIAARSLETAKCTSARCPNDSSGSGRPLVSGCRSLRYWLIASSRDWVKSVFSSTVATGSPLTKKTRSMQRWSAVEKCTCRITRTRIAAYCWLVVAFRLVSGRNCAIFNRPPPMYCTPLRRMLSVPPPCSSGLSSAVVSTSRNFACEPAAFKAFS